ncbi:hypothetical protein JYU34_014018 [Plutella xylostella]|uniref:CHK kinase-like domain-containing protein n=1 Tax=Plutella xylostella TaxID=51655 RepID=A0ABQ7Q8W6_PLUXY|nr:hypothetical protein JYU34_014018 [Plutella xylostella]
MDAQIILRELLQTVAREQDYPDPHVEVTAINSGGANYTSALFLASISAADKDDLKLFAKVAIIGEQFRQMIDGDRLFNNERFFYTELKKVYEALQDKHGVEQEHRMVFPKFYGYKDTYLEEIIVLEDLVAGGYGSHNRLKSVSWEYAAAAVSQLAKFHALSFAFQDEQPEEFARVADGRQFQTPDAHDDENNPWRKMAGGALKVVRDEYRGRLQAFLENNLDREKFVSYYRPRARCVLAHGDFRPSNLLCRRKDDKLEIVPVDYQTITAGCPANDLLYFIFTSSDKAFRGQHYQSLIDHYHRQLSDALKRLGKDVDNIYSKETLEQEVKELLPFGLLIAIFILPIVTVEAESAPKFDDITDMEIEPNALYADRFNGIVDDCVEWGVL